LLKPSNLGFHVVGFEIYMHAFLRTLLVLGTLKQEANLTIGKAQTTVHLRALWVHGLFFRTQHSSPEIHSSIEVVNVNYNVAESTPVGHMLSLEAKVSCTIHAR